MKKNIIRPILALLAAGLLAAPIAAQNRPLPLASGSTAISRPCGWSG